MSVKKTIACPQNSKKKKKKLRKIKKKKKRIATNLKKKRNLMRPEIYILMAIKCIVILNRNKTFVLKIQIKELRRQQMRPEIHIFF